MTRPLHLGIALLFVLCAACTSVGPGTVPKDRASYSNALSQSTHEQLLLNLVRLRYGEAPVFLEVSSVINQYTLEGGANAALGFGTSFSSEDTQTVGASGKWTDRPTITYVPLTGLRFSRSIMRALPPESMFALVQSGWPPDILLGLTVRSINGIKNDTANPATRQRADPEFWELIGIWRRLRDEGAIAFRLDEKEGKRNLVVFSREMSVEEEAKKDFARLREILGLAEDTREFRMVHGLAPTAPDEVAVLTRSTFEIMANLAWYMDAPAEHVCQGRTGATFRGTDGDRAPVVRARVSKSPPPGAFTAVHNRGYWFYIPDTDRKSKLTFTILEVLMSLSERTEGARGPVVTIGS